MEDYWGPPSFAWHGTGLFIAQNVGQLYIGAIPLLLLPMAALRGQLWAREMRFFTCAAAWRCCMRWADTRLFFACSTRCCRASVSTAGPPTRPFSIGGLAAILAGYGTHRLFVIPAPRSRAAMS